MVRLTVDGKEIEAAEGASLLEACLDNDIYIPNLCWLKDMEKPPAACRLCFVEVEGERGPVPSCEKKVREGMAVRTDTPAVRRLQKTVFELLFSAHHMDCKDCGSRKGCRLQKMAKFLGVKLKAAKLDELGRDLSLKPDHPFFDILNARCVLCQRCLYVCGQKNVESVLTMVRKGFDSMIDAVKHDDPSTFPCEACRACVEVCPVSAIVPKGADTKSASSEGA